MAAASPALIACGSGSEPASPEETAAVQQVAEQLRTYTKKGDAEGICGLFESQRMEDWIGGDCVKIFKMGLKQTPNKDQLKIEKIDVDGDQATVTFAYGTVDLNKIDGKWYLETPEIKVSQQAPAE